MAENKIFILIGHSDVQGRAPLAGAPAHANGERIWVYKYSGQLVQNPSDPICGGSSAYSSAYPQDPDAGVGPGLYFAERYLALHPDDNVILVPCAKGGIAISEYDRNLPAYGACVARVAEVIALVPGSYLAGVYFHQGARDAQSQSATNGWFAKFIALVANLRADLETPDLYFVMRTREAITNTGEYPYAEELLAIQKDVRIAGFKRFSHTYETLDGSHSTAGAQQEAGHLAAEIMASAMPPAAPPSGTVLTASSTMGPVVAPQGIEAGDRIVLIERGKNSGGVPIFALPNGFASVFNAAGNQVRLAISTKIADGSEGGQQFSGMTANDRNRKIILVFKNGYLSVGAPVFSAFTDGNPPMQTVIVSGSVAVVGVSMVTGQVTPSLVMSPVEDGCVALTELRVCWKQEVSGAVTLDMPDHGNQNIVGGFLLQ